MRTIDFTADKHGDIVHTIQDYDAYVPRDLPPPLVASWRLGQKISEADRALSELAGGWFILCLPREETLRLVSF